MFQLKIYIIANLILLFGVIDTFIFVTFITLVKTNSKTISS